MRRRRWRSARPRRGGRPRTPPSVRGLPHAAGEATAVLPLLGAEPCALPHLEPVQLALELGVALPGLGVERPVRKRGLDRAAGLAVVRAVGEAAPGGELLDVRERALDPVAGLPELELPHARGVEQD